MLSCQMYGDLFVMSFDNNLSSHMHDAGLYGLAKSLIELITCR